MDEIVPPTKIGPARPEDWLNEVSDGNLPPGLAAAVRHFVATYDHSEQGWEFGELVTDVQEAIRERGWLTDRTDQGWLISRATDEAPWVGVAGAARIADMTTAAVRKQAERGTMPLPLEVDGGGPVWARADIERWARVRPSRGRRPTSSQGADR